MGWGGEDVRLSICSTRAARRSAASIAQAYGPRDRVVVATAATSTSPATYTLDRGDALGGQTYWTTTAEVRFPIPLIPDELGISGAVFADAGSLFGAGALAKALNNQCDAAVPVGGASGGICLADSSSIRASVGGSILWNSPLGSAAPRHRQGTQERGLRQDPVDPLRRLDQVLGVGVLIDQQWPAPRCGPFAFRTTARRTTARRTTARRTTARRTTARIFASCFAVLCLSLC